jgi:hypothetical protein
LFCACGVKRDDSPVIPPVTSPLSRDYIGFGVITDSFTHIMTYPEDNSPSLGYLRRGSLVKILKRQIVRTNNRFTSWVFIDEVHRGWLREDVMVIYDSESRARTASESISR